MAKTSIAPENRIWMRGKHKGRRINDLPKTFLLHQMFILQKSVRKASEDPYAHLIVQEVHRRQMEHKAGHRK